MSDNPDHVAVLEAASEFAERLRDRRKALALSQTAAAVRSGVTLRTWQRWEAGDSKPHAGLLAGIAAALETTVEELLDVTRSDAPRALSDLALEARLARVETTTDQILEQLLELRRTLADPGRALRAADELLRSVDAESASPRAAR